MVTLIAGSLFFSSKLRELTGAISELLQFLFDFISSKIVAFFHKN